MTCAVRDFVTGMLLINLYYWGMEQYIRQEGPGFQIFRRGKRAFHWLVRQAQRAAAVKYPG